PWFSAVLLDCPLGGTILSMCLRKARRYSTGRADALHLPFLVYRRLVRWRGKRGNPFDFARRNSLASVCMWTLPLVCFACALFFWNDSAALMIAGWTFNAAYVLIYFCFVRFKIPAW